MQELRKYPKTGRWYVRRWCPIAVLLQSEGATINWVKDTTTDTITQQSTEEDGTVTELTTPIN